ncbi:MAG: diguanylate cyclase [Psychromonas sp.]
MEKYTNSIAERRLAKFLKIFCILPMFIFPPIIVLHYFKEIYILVLAEIIMLIIFATLLFFLLKPGFLKRKPEFLHTAAVTFTATIVILLVIAFFLPVHPTAFAISAVVISVIFLLLGRKRGLPLAIFIALLSIFIFLFKFSTGPNAIPAVALGNILMLIIMTFAISYLNESTRAEYEAALLGKNRKLQLLSNIDGLTQLFNRRYFDRTLRKEWNRLQRDNLYLSLILCDIDHFKQFNDIGGHLAGDICIRQIARCLQTVTRRSSDMVARYGGEEFVILLPQTDPEGAKIVAQKIMDNITDLAISHPAYRGKLVTLSLGVSSIIPVKELRPNFIISLADKALYESKDNGRNRITIKNHVPDNA